MRTFLFAGFSLLLIPMHAQDTTMTFPSRKNLIKLGLSSGFANTISLNYERVFSDEISAALTLSYMLPREAWRVVDLHTERIDLDGERELSGWFITPEVKWYLEKNDVRPAPRGFYVGLYGRVSDLRLESHISGTAATDSSSGTINGNLQVDLIEYGLGIDAGYQLLMIKDRLVLDFVFFGPRWAMYTVNVKADLNGSGDIAEDLEGALEDAIGRDLVPIDVEVSKTGTSSSRSNSLGYRAGFKLGFAF